MEKSLAEILATSIDAYHRCIKTGNVEWQERHARYVSNLVANLLPRGAGIDNGSIVDVDECRADRLVIHCNYHHMDESGMYSGWTYHKVIVTPSLIGDFTLKVTGRDRNDIKDYLADIYHRFLSARYTLEQAAKYAV